MAMMPAGEGSEWTARGGAWVHRDASLGDGVALEPGAVIGAGVTIGRGCRIGANAVVYGPTAMGEGNVVYPGAVLGGPPQDAHHHDDSTRLEIGDRNVFREHVTISRGSTKTEGVTRVGSGNYLMASSHLGHDVVLGDGCTLANGVLVAGHCRIGSRANLSGGTALVQFTTVGRLVFLGGLAGVRQDLEPFLIHDRSHTDLRVRPFGVNVVGLRRAGIAESTIRSLKTAYQVLFLKERPALEEARSLIERRGAAFTDEVEELLAFTYRKWGARFGRQNNGR